MLEVQDDSQVTPTITAYHRATTTPTFRNEAAAAFKRRLGGALKDISNSIEYDQLYRQMSTNLLPVLS